MNKRIFLFISCILFLGFFVWFRFLSPADSDTSSQIISFPNDTAKILVASKLKEQGFIRSELAANLIFDKDVYQAGGYEISKSMDIFAISKALKSGPHLLWVTVTPGMRKEQIAEKLAIKFNWQPEDLSDFLSVPEGQYFPDTYLIPRAVSGKQLAVRMNNNFNEKFQPYAQKFLAANIKNDTALKIASLLQRESGGDDMPLISGVIWNRLDRGMRLQIDATAQYAIGKRDGKWWSPVTQSDLKTDSPYNTYKNAGLPPTPISNASISALDAVLNPAQTDCLYYLHDRLRQIHCSVTYEEHLDNIEKYLR